MSLHFTLLLILINQSVEADLNSVNKSESEQQHLISHALHGLHWGTLIGRKHEADRRQIEKAIEGLVEIPPSELRVAIKCYLEARGESSSNSNEIALRSIDVGLLNRRLFGDLMPEIRGIWFGPDDEFLDGAWTKSNGKWSLTCPNPGLALDKPAMNSLFQFDVLRQIRKNRPSTDGMVED